MPKATDSNNPGDWVFMAESDLKGIRILATRKVSFNLCQSKLAEVLEKLLKAELIRLGWFLEKTHDLHKLAGELRARSSELADDAEELAEALAETYFAGRYPGFDLEEPDWPTLKGQVSQVVRLCRRVKQRCAKREPSRVAKRSRRRRPSRPTRPTRS